MLLKSLAEQRQQTSATFLLRSIDNEASPGSRR